MPLLQRVEHLFKTVIGKQELYVPVRSRSLYAILRQEAGYIAVEHEDSDLLVLMDGETAGELAKVAEISKRAHTVVLLDDAGVFPWSTAGNVVKHTCATPLQSGERILLLLSTTISLALLGQSTDDVKDDLDGDSLFLGGWTVRRQMVRHLAQSLLGDQAAALLPEIPANADFEDRISSAMMRLSASHAGALESREQNVAREKNNLLSILDVLKAISSKRHAHDILFVFVEQIARIIPVDRCSIVRVWENDDEGHVLVSHENEQILDCIIKLEKYPELTTVIDTGEPLTINDVATHPLTMKFRKELKKAGIVSLLVLPIVRGDAQVSTLILRAARRQGAFTVREVSFLRVVTEAAAHALERAHLFESIQIANERLEQLAITDSLTGLYNRRYFHERYEHEFARATRYKLPFSCVILDIDDFKQINDTYGHLVGDVVLKEMAARMRSCTRRVDILARYGGEEFVILLPQTNKEGAAIEAERVRAVMESHDFPQVPKDQRITVSIGVAALDCNSMKESDDLLRAADIALYEAKNRGKNCVVIHEPAGKED